MTGKFAAISSQPNPTIPGLQDIEPRELCNCRDRVAVIDVRRPDEFTGELGHIPNAELIALDTLPQRLHELPKDKPIVFVCRSGGRSGQAGAFALEQGFSNVYNLRGGMVLWNELGLAVTNKDTDI